MHHADVIPLRRLVPGLLAQLAPGTGEDVLTGVDLARRQFEKRPPQRITELTLEKQGPIGQFGHHHHGAGWRTYSRTLSPPSGSRTLSRHTFSSAPSNTCSEWSAAS
jgi:hypothetical protein